jgi:hypothetical protein
MASIMQDLGKSLIVFGLLLTAIGGGVWLIARTGFRGLPGDISYESRNVRVYFPIVTCIVLSVLLTGISWVWRWFQNR